LGIESQAGSQSLKLLDRRLWLIYFSGLASIAAQDSVRKDESFGQVKSVFQGIDQ